MRVRNPLQGLLSTVSAGSPGGNEDMSALPGHPAPAVPRVPFLLSARVRERVRAWATGFPRAVPVDRAIPSIQAVPPRAGPASSHPGDLDP